MVSISTTLNEALHVHAQQELEASLIYLQASHWFKVRHYEGFSSRTYSFGEKRGEWHRKILNYLTLRNTEVQVRAVALPSVEWTDELTVYEYFLKLEEAYYLKIKALYAQARVENDFDLEKFLHPLLKEQVERVDDWEGDVIKMRGYIKTTGLIWLYDNGK